MVRPDCGEVGATGFLSVDENFLCNSTRWSAAARGSAVRGGRPRRRRAGSRASRQSQSCASVAAASAVISAWSKGGETSTMSMPTRFSAAEPAHQLERLPASRARPAPACRCPARRPGRARRCRRRDRPARRRRGRARPRAPPAMPLRCTQGAVSTSSPSVVSWKVRMPTWVERAGVDQRPRGSPGPSSCRGRCGRDRRARGRRARRPGPAPAARAGRRGRASSGQATKWSPPSASSLAPAAMTSAAAASIAGATVSGWCGSSMHVAPVDDGERLEQVEAERERLELGELHAGGADRARPEAGAGAVGDGGVVGHAHHRDVDAGEVAGVAAAQERLSAPP